MLINDLALLISNELIRFVTGKLFTERQIRSITTHTVGRYFIDWFPEREEELKVRERVEEAKKHINEATNIITAMQVELANQSEELDHLLTEIETKKEAVQRYTNLAQISESEFAALKVEMEDALRKELRRQSEQGKRVRQFFSFLGWVFTLLIGAALGTYFKDIILWINN